MAEEEEEEEEGGRDVVVVKGGGGVLRRGGGVLRRGGGGLLGSREMEGARRRPECQNICTGGWEGDSLFPWLLAFTACSCE